MPKNAPQEGEWYMDRRIYIHVVQVDAGKRWATIHCYVMQPPNHYWNRIYMRYWTKEQPTPDGSLPDWELLPEPPDNILEALNWERDRRGYYAGPMRGM
jgi:hypothetical protein